MPGRIRDLRFETRDIDAKPVGYLYAGEAKIPIAVPLEDGRWYKAKPEGGGAIVFSADPTESKILSGWGGPNETEKYLQGAVGLHDEPIG